ncbi:MAG: phosphoglucosamine mutase [Lachnospiraceae bacterium]|nr:phosphoglucosamine mutase [Lachnospiraceae bacterium]MBQ4304855.1 phosphoglucosamine mutase [Lachnospiraceae bacterium]
MGKYFGTDGFRGEANVGLTADHAYKIGRFLGWYYGEIRRMNGQDDPARIVIGKDTRRSSYMFEYSLVGGMVASGADAYLLHVTTTPSVSYVTRVDGFDCGVMISASHNPYYDNGIKLLNSAGEKMDENTIALIEAYLDGELEIFGRTYKEVPFARRNHIGRTVDYVAGRNRYVGYLISQGMYSFRGKKVALDCANGAAWSIAKAVFDALGAETHLLNASPDGFNINQNAGSTHMEGLQKYVVENGMDVGFAYDGDADRCLCVDEKGRIVNGDGILYIYGAYMKERGKLLENTVVTTVMSNFGLYKAFDRLGIDYAKTAVGDKYVYEYMTSHGCRLGGEQSGHIIFSKYARTGDGILTSIKMMQVMMDKKMTLSELAAPLKIYPQELVNVKVADKKEAQNDPDVKEAVYRVEAKLGDTGRILVRESGTEPLIRVMVEAESKETCDRLAGEIVDVIRANGHAVD